MATRRKYKVTRRTAERLIRAAYEFEHFAAMIREDGEHDALADGVAGVARSLGRLGRSLENAE